MKEKTAAAVARAMLVLGVPVWHVEAHRRTTG
jgi:UDP-N-acetylglucosamine 2-epimerase